MTAEGHTERYLCFNDHIELVNVLSVLRKINGVDLNENKVLVLHTSCTGDLTFAPATV